MSTAKVILVTGAARRVGATIARTLHSQGFDIALHYRSSEADARALADSLNHSRSGSATLVAGDLSRPGEPERVAEQVMRHHQRLDGLVNNASSFFATPIGKITSSDLDELLGSNLRGPLFLSQALAPALIAACGAIVNIVDIHAERPLRGYPVYSAAKAGLHGLTRALALELAPHVRVNGVSPGAIEWPEDGQFPQQERQAIIAHTLLKRTGSPQDIANAVRFFMLDAPYVTGQILAVDGGRSAHL